MANENNQTNLPKRIAECCYLIPLLTVKLHNTDASIRFIKQTLYAHVTPKFTQIKG